MSQNVRSVALTQPWTWACLDALVALRLLEPLSVGVVSQKPAGACALHHCELAAAGACMPELKAAECRVGYQARLVGQALHWGLETDHHPAAPGLQEVCCRRSRPDSWQAQAPTGCSTAGTAQAAAVSGPHCCHSSSMEGSWKVLGRNENSLVNWDSVHLLVNQPDPGSWLTCSHQAAVTRCRGQQITPLQRPLVAGGSHALLLRSVLGVGWVGCRPHCSAGGRVQQCWRLQWRPQGAGRQGLAC